MFQDPIHNSDDEMHEYLASNDLQEAMRLELLVEDRDLVEILDAKKPGRERTSYGLAALRIGLLALENANNRIDAEKIRSEGDRLLETMNAALGAHRADVTKEIAKSLADYFDPTSGRLSQRVEQLIKKDGDLEKTIRSQIEGEGSAMANTLKTHLGHDSPLLSLLDPQSKNGLASNLTRNLDDIAREQRDTILKEFSLDNQDGALSRTLRELKQRHGEAGEAIEKQINTFTAELSLDNDDSALSKLVARVDRTQRTLSDEFSLDKDDSALARMRKEIFDQINALVDMQKDFQGEVKKQLGEMVVRKAESLKSTTHGIDFESALFTEIQNRSQPRGDIAEKTGNNAGRIKNCKVGDIVVELGPDHHCAGTKIVIEAKQNKSIKLNEARNEIELARRNRDAQVGVFVYSARSAPEGLSKFNRLGNDIFVVWDQEDPSTDLVLDATLSLASAMIMQGVSESAEFSGDFETIDRALLSIQKQIEGLDEFDKTSDTITLSANKIRERTRKMRNHLTRELKNLNETIAGVKNSLEG